MNNNATIQPRGAKMATEGTAVARAGLLAPWTMGFCRW